MRKSYHVLVLFLCSSFAVQAQTGEVASPVASQGSSLALKDAVMMPYNRLIRSAGKVVYFGDSSMENHALDLALLPDQRHMVIEDRYGITVMDISNDKIIDSWRINRVQEFRELMSTYSGITCFNYQTKTYIVWGAAGRRGGRSELMVAEWNGKKLGHVSGIPLALKAPAAMALPNQVIARNENDGLFLYVVLNGNDQLVKIRFDDRKVVWTGETGVAPFGVSIIGQKAYVTNWAGPIPTDDSLEKAGVPWGNAYTNPTTGATARGSLSILDIQSGKKIKELDLGLHPNAIVKSADEKYLFVSNGNSDYISVINVSSEKVVDSVKVGLFESGNSIPGSSPNGLLLDIRSNTLYVANGMDNAIAVVKLNEGAAGKGLTARVKGFIPTEAYPAGMVIAGQTLYVANLEGRGAAVQAIADDPEFQGGVPTLGYTIHRQLASVSIIPLPSPEKLKEYTQNAQSLALYNTAMTASGAPRSNVLPKPVPERLGEPSVFKHVIYIIKENKTYDQVFGDKKEGRGDKNLCIFGERITPNQHKLAGDFVLLDNYFASGKSSAEGHQWANAAMVSDYVEKMVRAWFRSYPHRQEDALVYNKNGFIWNNAMDHGKKVRIYGEACLTHHDPNWKWSDIYDKYLNEQPLNIHNTTTIARIRPVISPNYPDNDNLLFTDQIRADVFIGEWNRLGTLDSLPDLMVLSLPNNHTAGTAEHFPIPKAMVADNDLALGKIVEAVVNSKYWDSTVIFVTEDDSQSGWDHISPYRTVGQVISAYSNLNKLVHTNYNQTSMVKTIEQILGLPPMNVIDATASPMFDCFGDQKQAYTFRHLPSNVPLNQMNSPVSRLSGKARNYALISASRAFKGVDSGDDLEMNKIIWFSEKGDQKYPGGK